MESHKILSLNELIKKELGTILLEEFEFPEGTIATITNVDTSLDLQHTRVYVSIIPDAQAKEIISNLSKNVFKIQQALNEKLRMHPTPKIEWLHDESTTNIMKVEELLEKIKGKNN